MAKENLFENQKVRYFGAHLYTRQMGGNTGEGRSGRGEGEGAVWNFRLRDPIFYLILVIAFLNIYIDKRRRKKPLVAAEEE